MERTQAYEGRIDWLANALELVLDIVTNDDDYTIEGMFDDKKYSESHELVDGLFALGGYRLKKYIQKYGYYETEAVLRKWCEMHEAKREAKKAAEVEDE